MWLDIVRMFQLSPLIYVVSFIGLVAYILLNFRNPMLKKTGLAVILFLLFYPVWHILLGKTLSHRLIWVFPVLLVVTLGITKYLQTKKMNIIEVIWLMVVCFGLYYGNDIGAYCKTYTYNDSIYRIQKTVIEAAQIIENDTDDDKIVVVSEEWFMLQIRLYSTDFYWGYESRECMRRAEARLGVDAQHRVATAIQTGYLDENVSIIDDLHELGVEYVVLNLSNTCLDGYENYYEIIGETYACRVYKMK